jgi:glucose/mannose-6-phosphate isomerase
MALPATLVPPSMTHLAMAHEASFEAWIESKAQQIQAGYDAGRRAAISLQDAVGVAVLGMGGSGAAGQLVMDAYQPHTSKPLALVQDYALPGWVGRGWEVLAVSYSGRTEETLAAATEAKRRGAHLTAFTTGGPLAEMADHTVLQVPGYQPRAAIGHLWMSVVSYLESGHFLPGKLPVDQVVAGVREVDARCGFMSKSDNPARSLAAQLIGRVPHIYATPAYHATARFFSALLNENAKVISHAVALPEANHNDLMGWAGDERRSCFAAIALSEARPHAQLEKRLTFMRDHYTQWGVPWHDWVGRNIRSLSDHIVEQARAIQFAEYVSYYHALEKGVNPKAIETVEELKRYLA